jgi:SAM-dependent methyltransferase
LLVVCFGGVLLVGAPYLPTLSPQIKEALELAELKKGQTLLELGCGDGRVLIAAAKSGAQVIGYELNPLLYMFAWLRTRRYRSQVCVRWGNFWRASWPPADVIFVFLLPKYMSKLDKQCMRYPYMPITLVSIAFPIASRQPQASRHSIYLYRYGD